VPGLGFIKIKWGQLQITFGRVKSFKNPMTPPYGFQNFNKFSNYGFQDPKVCESQAGTVKGHKLNERVKF
jgi:hypothetical protein